MQNVQTYIADITGAMTQIKPVPQDELRRVPLFLSESYLIYKGKVFGIELLLALQKEGTQLTTGQIMKNMQALKGLFGQVVVLVTNEMTGIRRRRLITGRINFIVPGKQMFLPELMVDLRERGTARQPNRDKETLLPSAQFILIYHILHRLTQPALEELAFKDISKLLHYTPMAISNAVENLQLHGLCNVSGSKEKYLNFKEERAELWELALPFMTDPLIKRVYVDELPKGRIYKKTGMTALAEYSNISPEEPGPIAIGKQAYYAMERTGVLKNLNSEEGTYPIDIWKYDPEPLAFQVSDQGNVDPLSLYLTLQGTEDERIDMALETVLEKYIW
jgi:hypothetical protein